MNETMSESGGPEPLKGINLSDPLDVLTPLERERLARDLADIATRRRMALDHAASIYLD